MLQSHSPVRYGVCMATPTQPKPKTPRLSDVAKNALRSQRRRLATEQADEQARRAMEARAMLGRETKPVTFAPPPAKMRVTNTALAFCKSVVPRTAAVLASEGVKATVRVDLSPDAEKSAWTDFRSIHVSYPVESDNMDVVELSAIIRGEVYHEGGHCRFTMKLDERLSLYRADTTIPQAKRDRLAKMWAEQRSLLHYAWNLSEDQYMEQLVVEDSPRKAAYFAPMVIDMVIDYRKNMTSMESQRTQYADTLRWFVLNGMLSKEQADAMPFNEQAAEQQRVAAYPLIVWRRYLPRDLRRKMRAEFAAVWGDTMTRRIDRLVLTYITGATNTVKIDALMELAPLLQQVMTPPVDHSQMEQMGRYTSSGKDSNRTPSMPGAEQDYEAGDDEGDESDGDDVGQGTPDPKGKESQQQAKGGSTPSPTKDEGEDEDGAGKGKGDEDGDDEGEGEDGDDEDGDDGHTDDAGSDRSNVRSAPNSPAKGSTKGAAPVDHDPLAKALEEAKAQAEEERNADNALKGDVEAFNHAIYDGNTGSQLLPYATTPQEDPGVVAQAMGMAQQIVQAFHEVNVEKQPTWQEQQTRGVLNVGRYITRQPGDREYFRAWADEVVPGRNLAVSVLLDYSGSMSSNTKALATVAYAMKSACDELGMPCTVVLWDHDAALLWDGEDRAEFVPTISANGGTDPQTALEDVPFQRYDKDQHIVLVMTDGQFSSKENWLNEWRTEGTYFLGAVYSPHFNAASAKQTEDRMGVMGFDQYMAISTLEPLARLLEAAIVEMSQQPVM